MTGLMLFSAAPAMADEGGRTLVVWPGVGTISAAVAAASPGDTLQLEEGTFYDSVEITKTLTIRGEGSATVIKPPPKPPVNDCNSPGSVEGLCASGQLDSQGNPVASKPVVDVRISDLRTTGFSDSGVIGFNTRGLRVTDVRSDHNGGYGIARFFSTGSLFADNWTSFNSEAGLYVGDSPQAKSVVVDNHTEHNGIGVFLRDSTDVVAERNVSTGNCAGILGLNTGQGATGPSGAGHYLIKDNDVARNDSACAASDTGKPLSGIGIALAGVQGNRVIGNDVDHNAPTGPSVASGGIIIVSPMGKLTNDNLVKDNDLRGNRPADIVWDQLGSGNRVTDNACATAMPANLGWCVRK
ncbi:MAG: right-handed parallel beta-helix repeat-containing protein [Actinobacteria bacterium]|nr:right-handed parallel beta-helix repeat-containing protein [Actinomycetota bacterium]